MSGATSSPLDPYIAQIKTWATEGKTNAEIVKALAEFGIDTSEASVRRAKKRDENQAPRTKGEPTFQLSGDEATINSAEEPTPPSPEDLMAKHGLNPEDWEVKDVILNEWTSMMGSQNENRLQKMYQLKVILRRVTPINFVFPAMAEGAYVAPRFHRTANDGTKSKLWLVLGDQQAPYHDEDMHKAICSLIATENPDGAVLTGDTVDFPDISRHRDNPEWHVSAQACIDSGYLILRDYRIANEKMKMVKLLGNHDVRIRNELLNRAERLYGLRKAQIPGEEEELSVLHMKNLLRLDELNIEMIDPNGDYEHAQYSIGPNIAVRHGSRTGSNAALKTVDRLTHSVIMGHTHQQSLQHRTIYDINRVRRTITAVETGACCKIDGGLGYAVDPNWVNGIATVEVWPDGTHHIELAVWDGEALYWRDKKYS